MIHTILVEAETSPAELERINERRRKLGMAEHTHTDYIENLLCDVLRDKVITTSLVTLNVQTTS